MNDIVITYDKTINSENRLKLIIRAIEKHCDGYNEIFLIGDKPDWIQGVVHIDFSPEEDKKLLLRHKFKKLKSVCTRKELTDNFYWVDANDSIPVFDARKGLRVSIAEDSIFFQKPKGTDKIAYEHTKKLMSRRGFPSRNFFNNFPISFNKKNIMNIFDDVDFETFYGYCIKTLYCNFNRMKPTNEFMSSIDLTSLKEKSTYEKV